MRLKLQDVQRIVGQFAADQVGQRAHLAGADARESVGSYAIMPSLSLAFLYPSHAV
jgi:hypothetical protein